MSHGECQRPGWSSALRIEDAWTFCGIWVRLMDEAAWGPDLGEAFDGWSAAGDMAWGKSHAEPQRLICSGGKSHAEPQPLICPGELRIDHDFCPMWVKLLMDEAVWEIWPEGSAGRDMAWGEEPCWTSTVVRSHGRPEGKSHAEPERLIRSCGLCIESLRGRAMLNLNGWSGPTGFALQMLEHFCRIWVKLLMDEALRVIGPEGKSHAEPQRLTWSSRWRRFIIFFKALKMA